jgi:hypothetical protein
MQSMLLSHCANTLQRLTVNYLQCCVYTHSFIQSSKWILVNYLYCCVCMQSICSMLCLGVLMTAYALTRQLCPSTFIHLPSPTLFYCGYGTQSKHLYLHTIHHIFSAVLKIILPCKLSHSTLYIIQNVLHR